MLAPAQAALDGAEQDLGFRRLDKASLSRDCPKISLDYAIMEKGG